MIALASSSLSCKYLLVSSSFISSNSSIAAISFCLCSCFLCSSSIANSSIVANLSMLTPSCSSIALISSLLRSFVTLYKPFLADISASIALMFDSDAALTASAFSSAALSVNPIQSVNILNPSMIAVIGNIKSFNTLSRTPILFKNIAMAATIATITATNKNIGLASICIPNLTNAPPIVCITPVNALNPLDISAGFILPITLLNT